jgi:hypothetical protein
VLSLYEKNHMTVFFILEYAGKLRIIVLRRNNKVTKLQRVAIAQARFATGYYTGKQLADFFLGGGEGVTRRDKRLLAKQTI